MFIKNDINQLKLVLKSELEFNDGITDSIKLSLENLRFKRYRILLKNLIKMEKQKISNSKLYNE
ncbi:hypothetical protein BpHYR1_050277 [Brachionus plicatilis]|uniref:Uncharacterized protein n=1 Tax=Brachionus plicatilis TaxID=10195 RepID=A0A3M7QRD1_BRAPC|nr:hypothetical protein BpHYR1_050277 [Brachionus plicatilis]